LRRHHYKTAGWPGAETVRSGLDLLEARAQFGAPAWVVHIRVGEHLGPEKWHNLPFFIVTRH